ncbi:unnamed protein product [Mycetohabitans rhizoxinica HKI 454]|uniref:Uncharacterized protein n=1 Tax=Mycetohabitans rhizoxinica (strain DSM 19002 / CIP 109453 / HKI 454) TaxID=882378 RepID=E5AQB0_MYCRK|nr:unnamed protein product [Mycetohabitans rhizoxinica HKI 454]
MMTTANQRESRILRDLGSSPTNPLPSDLPSNDAQRDISLPPATSGVHPPPSLPNGAVDGAQPIETAEAVNRRILVRCGDVRRRCRSQLSETISH